MLQKTSEVSEAADMGTSNGTVTTTSTPRRAYRLDREGNIVFLDRQEQLRKFAQKYSGTGIPR